MNRLPNLMSKIQGVDVAQLPQDQGAQAELLRLTREVTTILEGPVNRATDLVFKPYTTVAARIAVDLDLFNHICAASGDVTSKQLANLTRGDELLISRILRLLAATGFVDNTGEDEWKSNETTQAMAMPAIEAGHRFVFDVLVSSAMKAPKYLSETKYQVPTEPTDTFVQYAFQTRLPFFQYLQSMPSLMHDFNLFMGNTMGNRQYWHDWYDVRKLLLTGFDRSHNSVLLVDVGSGKGHDMLAFHQAFADSATEVSFRLVLQDLPPVLESVSEHELPAGFEKMPHDFFTEQPVKAARGYFLHHILHDWSDQYCIKILRCLRKAMLPGYSKLLIHELILPNSGAEEIQARFDLVMMTLSGGMERSRTQWVRLLEEAGFCNITLYEHLDHDGIIEAEVPNH
ncbi:unnamed protein product [Periconia digitata]|uniref:O-methyltransferase C-terminal domain-containing protein n=1 Tax=Periconia digitata TaxID=1303443 RepID=A0A9W4XE36_9PLEO|nr:unnamed protein product [Periconia digitata]